MNPEEENGAATRLRVITTYLEMLDAADLRPGRAAPESFRVDRAQVPYPGLNRFLYGEVGRDYGWTDRLAWCDAQWLAWLDRPQLQTWLGYLRGTPAGYFELESQADGNVELAYFGLLPPFVGQGIGAALLTTAVGQAWAWGADRVWVHTCSLDHPAALPNYQARGFQIYDQQAELRTLDP